MRIVLLGAPGSGKGTQGEKLVARFGIPKVSTGDALRAAVNEGTALGKRAKVAMDAGELVANEIVIGIVDERLQQPDARKGFILDGFPRNVTQAKALDEMLSSRGERLDAVVELRVDASILLSRIEKRAAETAGGARADDNAEALKKRLKVYEEQTAPLSGYYQDAGILKAIDGMKDMDAVTADIEAALELKETDIAG